VAAVGGLSATLVAALALPMVLEVGRADYADSYAAYRSRDGLGDRVRAVVRDVGPGYAFAAAAAAAFLACRPATRRPALFVGGMAPVIVLHFLRVQDFAPHHLYLLLPAVLLPIATAAAVLLGRLPGWAAAAGVAGLAAAGAVALAAAVEGRAAWVHRPVAPLLSAVEVRPLTRPDLDECRRLVRFLDAETGRTGERFAVVSSSAALHPSMLAVAGWSLREPFPGAARLEPAGDVDRVNGFPAGVFRAGLVVVADPPQTHLAPAEQQTVLVPARHLLGGTGIGRAFDRLPEAFALADGVTVRVYRRARPVAPEDLAAFAAELRRAHPCLPHVFTPPPDVTAAAQDPGGPTAPRRPWRAAHPGCPERGVEQPRAKPPARPRPGRNPVGDVEGGRPRVSGS
jgi:hypothetical protein